MNMSACLSRQESRQIVQQKLLTYCKEGNLSDLIAHLGSRSASSRQQLVHRKFNDGQTCLIAACRNGQKEIVEYLVEHCQADIEQVGSVMFDGEQVEGVPPLWCAAAAGHIKVVEYLVMRNAQINRTTITNSTALRAACFDGHEKVVKYLVNHRADIEIPNRHGHTCLMISCYRGHDKIVEFLLTRGARVNRQSAKGNTALHDCAESGNLKSLQLLLQYGAVMRKDEYGLSPIMAGANSGYKKVVDYLATADDLDIPVEEKAAAYELLGANLFDRQNSVQEAVAAWRSAMSLRQVAFGFEKRIQLPPGLVGSGGLGVGCLRGAGRAGGPNGDPESDDTLSIAESTYGGGAHEDIDMVSVSGDDWDDEMRSPPPVSIVNDSVEWDSSNGSGVTSTSRQRKGARATGACSSAGAGVSLASDHCLQDDPPDDEPDSEEQPISSSAGSSTRTTRTSGTTPCPELLDDSRLRNCAHEAFGEVREFASTAELDALLATDPDNLKLQTLLIRLRLLGPDHPDTIYFIRYRGAIYADSGNIQRCLVLWMYALELQRLYLEPLCHVAQSAFLSFAELFIYILSDSYSAMPSVGLNPAIIVDCLELCIENIDRGQEYSYYRWYNRQPWSYTTADKEATNLMRHAALCLQYIAMVSIYFLDGPDELKRAMSEEVKERFFRQVYRLVKLDPRVHHGYSLLHLACSPETGNVGRYPICPFPSVPVVRLLIRMGADPDQPDAEGHRPIGMAYTHRTTHSMTVQSQLLRALVESGAHLDARNKRDLTALDQRARKYLQDSGIQPLRYLTLKCLCARVIRNCGIHVTPGCLPAELHTFLEMH